MFEKWSSSIPKDCTSIMNCYTVLHFLSAGPVILVITTSMCQISWNLGASTSWNPLDLKRHEQGLLYLLPGKAAVFKLDAGSGLTSCLTLFPVFPEEKNSSSWKQQCCLVLQNSHFHLPACHRNTVIRKGGPSSVADGCRSWCLICFVIWGFRFSSLWFRTLH